MAQSLPYRPEIDALRAIAVLAVVVYHLNPQWLKGGFLGVDVFLVISGYLITTILNHQMRSGQFGLKSFWHRRFRRLVPVLAVVVSACLITGAWLLPNPERAALPPQAVAAIASFSNVLLWKTTDGYWSQSSDDFSLLHTWSLSLEEQFYVIFPVLLWIVHRYLKRWLGWVLVGLAILSFACCLYFSEGYRANMAFYVLPTRMWELLLGSLLALVSITPSRPAIGLSAQILGLSLIAFSFLYLEHTEGFPGAYPLIPCLGAALWIWSGGMATRLQKALICRPMLGIGLGSYSLYLWHWPVIVFSYYLSSTPSIGLMAGVIAVFSWLSYVGLEKPIRSGKLATQRLLVSLGLMLSLSAAVFFGIKNPPSHQALGNIGTAESMTRGWEFEATESLSNQQLPPRDATREQIVLLGSSHARVLGTPLARFAEQHQMQLISLATSNVGLGTPSHVGSPNADRLNELKKNAIVKYQPDTVIVAGMWSSELSDEGGLQRVQDGLVFLSTHSRRVIVIGQVPLLLLPENFRGGIRKFMVAEASRGAPPVIQSDPNVAIVNRQLQQLVQSLAIPNVVYLDPESLFVLADGSVKYLDQGKMLYSDFHHLNDAGAALLISTKLPHVLTP